MSLALLTFGLLCACPTQAQTQGGYPGGGSGGGYPGSGSGSGYPGGGPAPDPGHYWQITYSRSKAVNIHFERDIPTMGQMTPTDSQGGSTIINGDVEATVTATLTWVPAAGQTLQTDPPTEPVCIMEHGWVEEASLWGGPGQTPMGQGTADDGIGDAPVPWCNGLVSQGDHLIQRDGSSGTITLDAVTVKAINPPSTWHTGIFPYWDWTGGISSGADFSVSANLDSHSMNVVPLRVDATDPHNAKVWFRTEPAGAVAQTVTFTGGSPATQTQSSVSGDFSFTFDEGQLPSGTSTFTLQWTPASPYVAIPGGGTVTTTATQTSHMATGSSPLFYSVTAGGIDGGLVLVVPTQYYDARETYNTFSYSLPVVAESKTIWVGGSDANLGTFNNPNLPGQIFGWGETHYYQDDSGTYGSGPMQNETWPTVPAQSLWFQSKNLSSNLFFAPNHNLVAISHCDSIVLNATNSPATVIPFFYTSPTITVPIN